MWEATGRVQVSKRELHTLIHLDYDRVEFLSFIKKLRNYKKKSVAGAYIGSSISKGYFILCNRDQVLHFVPLKKNVLHFVWEYWFAICLYHGATSVLLLCFVLCCVQELCPTFPKPTKLEWFSVLVIELEVFG